MIKDNYIVNVLGMDVNDYPTVQRICTKRKENISAGLKEVDLATGLTKYELGQIKAREILRSVDENGVSGYKKKGQKTRTTHLLKVDEFGRNGYSVLATKAIMKGNRTKAKNGLISLDRNEFSRYKLIVLYLTEKLRKEITHGFITGLAGKEGAWHIDHRYSILKGYQNKVSPFVIGNRSNLEMVPWKDNLSKHSSCSISLGGLLQSCGYSEDQSLNEFNKFVFLINNDIRDGIPPNGAFLIERYYATNLRT